MSTNSFSLESSIAVAVDLSNPMERKNVEQEKNQEGKRQRQRQAYRSKYLKLFADKYLLLYTYLQYIM